MAQMKNRVPSRDLLIGPFIAVGVFIALWSWHGDFEDHDGLYALKETAKRVEESHFKNIQYFLVRKERPELLLNADELAINPEEGKTISFAPHGIAYTQDQKPVNYTSQNGVWFENERKLSLAGFVKIHYENSEIMSDTLDYFLTDDFAIANGHIKSNTYVPKNGDRIKINSDKAFAWPKLEKARYLANVSGHILRQRPYEESIYFNCEDLIFFQPELKIELLDNVVIKKQGITSNAHRGEIFLENYNKKLKYYTLYDDVRITETVKLADGRTVERKAFGEKLQGIMSEDKVILTGSPKVLQENDIIKGNTIILRQNSEVVEVDDANSRFILR